MGVFWGKICILFLFFSSEGDCNCRLFFQGVFSPILLGRLSALRWGQGIFMRTFHFFFSCEFQNILWEIFLIVLRGFNFCRRRDLIFSNNFEAGIIYHANHRNTNEQCRHYEKLLVILCFLSRLYFFLSGKFTSKYLKIMIDVKSFLGF